MTTDNDESDQSIANDVLPIEITQPAIPVELNKLFAWHRPRKQFIRERQWLSFSKRLIEKIAGTPALPVQPDGSREVKYLSLPGIDYLDVQLLSKCCKELGCILTNTGYLATGEDNPTRARAQVREESLIEGEHISIRSQTYNRRLEEVSHVDNSAYRDLRRRGPFHIVNIDACGSIAPTGVHQSQRMIDAIYRIIEYQLETHNGNWLLFLTADVRYEHFSTETLANLTKAIIQNAKQCDDFQAGALSLLGTEGQSLIDAIDSAKKDGNENYIKLFSLGFSKWLLHLAQGKGWDMKMHNSYFYSTSEKPSKRPTMPCLAFEFVPPAKGLDDPYSVVNVAPTMSGEIDNTSLRALQKTVEMTNLDKMIQEDPNLRSGLVATTKELLEKIGYAASAIEAVEELDLPEGKS